VSIEGAVKPGQLLLVAYVYGIPEKNRKWKKYHEAGKESLMMMI
jgi:hypothetical protein